ncbi:MAG: flagellar protein FlgN [Pseudomonadota bacterium]
MVNQAVKDRSETKTKQHVLLSKDPKKAMQEMMEIIDNLRGIMASENEALNNADTKAFIAIQDEKIQAARVYQDGINQMIARKEDMRKAPESMKAQLEDMRTDFLKLADENLEALERMRKGMSRLSDRIMNLAKSEASKSQKFVYGSHGKLEGSGKASIGVNERA